MSQLKLCCKWLKFLSSAVQNSLTALSKKFCAALGILKELPVDRAKASCLQNDNAESDLSRATTAYYSRYPWGTDAEVIALFGEEKANILIKQIRAISQFAFNSLDSDSVIANNIALKQVEEALGAQYPELHRRAIKAVMSYIAWIWWHEGIHQHK